MIKRTYMQASNIVKLEQQTHGASAAKLAFLLAGDFQCYLA